MLFWLAGVPTIFSVVQNGKTQSFSFKCAVFLLDTVNKGDLLVSRSPKMTVIAMNRSTKAWICFMSSFNVLDKWPGTAFCVRLNFSLNEMTHQKHCQYHQTDFSLFTLTTAVFFQKFQIYPLLPRNDWNCCLLAGGGSQWRSHLACLT